MKDDILSLFCTFDDLGIFHLKSANFETLNCTCTYLSILIIFTGLLIYFCLSFTKIKAISVTVAGITMSITAWVWVTPAVVVLESLSLTGSISSLATGHWLPPGLGLVSSGSLCALIGWAQVTAWCLTGLSRETHCLETEREHTEHILTRGTPSHNWWSGMPVQQLLTATN